METKCCRKCKRDLPLTAFNRDSSKPDGLQGICRECANAQYRQWYYRWKEKKRNFKLY